LIHPAGVPFLLLGPEGERALVERWEREHKVPVFTNAMSQVRAMRAFGARRIISASYFAADINRLFADYLVQAGFEVLGTASYDVPFQDVPRLTPAELRAFFDRLYLPHKGRVE